MNKYLIYIGLLLSFIFTKAQTYNSYQPTSTVVNSLVHTKLNVKFDIPNEKLMGEEWLTLQPHFYPTGSLSLDAKGMIIHEVKLDKGKALKYDYVDNSVLKISLDKTYKKGEKYTIYIKYTAIPANVTQKGSAAISEAKGLYFINPRGENPNKATQVWTQGETEASSCWFPTIDKTNQRTSQEIYMTVPDKYITLSNGELKSQNKNNDGTRTDYWKFDKKHPPYLFFMGVGDFAVIKDKWKSVPVDYYVEKEYEPYAKQIFGNTPEMIQFFSDKLNYPYPWNKYAQMTAIDYVSGAMENTTAVLHSDKAQQKEGQLIDKNIWETVIAHELFHHWFGDLVTAESWSNLAMNESFANYSEYLWLEHKFGKNRAEEHKFKEKQGYITPDNFKKELIRFHYHSREDVFDAVTYNKGGIILHMLRNYLGDEAFYAGLNLYLRQNEYKSTEAHHLRFAFEEVSGKDLNWFFNQWFFGAGHPIMKISYSYDDANKKVKINIKQTQDNKFQFPLVIDIYEKNSKKRHNIWINSEEENIIELPYSTKPELININPDDLVLSEIEDDKSIEQYIIQYKKSTEYASRRIAIEKLSKIQSSNKEALSTLMEATKDNYEGLRELAVNKIESEKISEKNIKIIEKIANSDSHTKVRAEAYLKLGEIDAKKYVPVFEKAVNEKSYAIKAAAINSLLKIDKNRAASIVNSINDKQPKGELLSAIVKVAITTKDMSKSNLVAGELLVSIFTAKTEEESRETIAYFQEIMIGDYKYETKTFVDELTKTYAQIKTYPVAPQFIEILQASLQMKEQAYSYNKSESLKYQVDYIKKGLENINAMK